MEESCCIENTQDDNTFNTEIMYLKRQEQSSVDETQSPPLDRHVQPTPDCTLPRNAVSEQIEVGAFYEIDHTRLPANSPVQLSPIRIVMVSEKTELNVSLRLPSIFSLRTHFNNGNHSKLNWKMNPALDEKYVMASNVAKEVLSRRIPSQEFAGQKNSWSFWVVPSMETDNITALPSNDESRDVISKKGSCWSEIKYTGMVQWGIRRQVRFLGRHNIPQFSLSSVEEEMEKEGGYKEEEEEEEEEDKEECNEKSVRAESNQSKKNRKRKCPSSSRIQNAKKAKREKEKKSSGFKKAKILKNSKDRWSAERYKLAEENMLKILKTKGAVFGNPILRPELRQEARKLIGDTGLLDHLLKHMAGKVTPGGAERFRRRHNAEGAMEYWLENAALVDVRRDAGVQDPYWTPPSGWKPGDSLTQDPNCAMELKQLREEMAKMKRDMEELVSKKQEEPRAIVRTPNFSVTNQNMGHGSSLLSLKETYEELVKRKFKIEEQLMEISQSLSRMKEEMEKLTATVEEPKRSESGAAVVRSTTSPGTEKEGKEGKENKGKALVAIKVGEYEKEEQKEQEVKVTTAAAAAAAKAEEKAAQIRRLKSGFRICKPQGTFLWPNMANTSSPQVLVQLDNLLMAPTPPSVSSSTAAAAATLLPPPPPPPPTQNGHGTHSNSPVKPLAQRRAVTVNVSTTVTRASPETRSDHGSNTTCNTPTGRRSKATTLLDLNDAPVNNHNDTGFCGTSTSLFSTYQRRHNDAVTAMPRVSISQSNREAETSPREEGETKGLVGYRQQQQRGYACSSSPSCLSMGVGTWLALATPNSPSLDNTHRR